MYVRFKDGLQDRYPVWENVLLIQASTHKLAAEMAQEIAKREEGDSDGSFRWSDRPAERVFAGIRKTVEMSHEGEGLGHGDEVTYSEFVLANEEALRALVGGEEVSVRYLK